MILDWNETRDGWYASGGRCEYLIFAADGRYTLMCACDECVPFDADTLAEAKHLAEEWDETVTTLA